MFAHYQYLALLAMCLLGTLFLEVLFDARIWRRPLTVVRALALPWVAFNLVNEIAVFRGLWSYSPYYTTGWRVPRQYPVEELCFFVAIPICALLTFEAATAVYSGRVVPPWSRAGRVPPSPVVQRSKKSRGRPGASAVAAGALAVTVAVTVALLALAALAEGRSLPSAGATAKKEYALLSRRFDWNIREYPVLVVLLITAVLLLEFARWQTGLFHLRAYWSTMVICLAFMVPVNGWLTKLRAPIVIYAADEFSGLRPVLDIPLEDFVFGLALLTLVLMSWVRVTARPATPATQVTADGASAI